MNHDVCFTPESGHSTREAADALSPLPSARWLRGLPVVAGVADAEGAARPSEARTTTLAPSGVRW